MARSQWSVAPDDDAADMYERGMEHLEAAGYVQYEISNVARDLPERLDGVPCCLPERLGGVPSPRRACRHNLKYWTDGAWLGFGPGAHSKLPAGTPPRHSLDGGVRWKNLSATADYVAAVESGGAPLTTERRVLTRQEGLEEALFMGLRLAAGVDLGLVESRYGCDVWRQFGDRLQPFVDHGLLIYDGLRLKLTRPGMLMANEIMAVFIASN